MVLNILRIAVDRGRQGRLLQHNASQPQTAKKALRAWVIAKCALHVFCAAA